MKLLDRRSFLGTIGLGLVAAVSPCRWLSRKTVAKYDPSQIAIFFDGVELDLANGRMIIHKTVMLPPPVKTITVNVRIPMEEE